MTEQLAKQQIAECLTGAGWKVSTVKRSGPKREPKDIPLLLRGPLVRAFLAGQKTVTRRTDLDKWRKAKPGDRIWFKETTVDVETHGYTAPKGKCVFAESDTGRDCLSYGLGPQDDFADVESEEIKLRPSIYMRKEWARCWAVIEDLREERLQDITEEDVSAEGVTLSDFECGYAGKCNSSRCPRHNARPAFAELWDSINGKKPGLSWSDNPTVARIQFRRVEPTND